MFGEDVMGDLPRDWKCWDDSIFAALRRQGECGITIYGREKLTVELCEDCKAGRGFACVICGRMSDGPRECFSSSPHCAQKKHRCGFPRLRDQPGEAA